MSDYKDLADMEMRLRYADKKEVAFSYFVKGLNSKEVAAVMTALYGEVSHRTIQGYMSAENWKSKREEIQERERLKIIALHEKAVQKAITKKKKGGV